MSYSIINEDVLKALSILPDGRIDCCVTSPPYWGLRDYGITGQLGLEPSPQEYVADMVRVFREVRRVLSDKGTLWLNIGDTYAGGHGPSTTPGKSNSLNRGGNERKGVQRWADLKPKDLIGIPWRVALALQADGWYLRSDIIWHKPNVMPESVKDRPTKAHEYVFLMTKSEAYHYDSEAIKEDSVYNGPPKPGKQAQTAYTGLAVHHGQLGVGGKDGKRNRRSVWSIATRAYRGAHFAVFPEALVEPCVLGGSPVGGTVLDPFCGSGTTGAVALKHGRNFIGIELNPEYVKLAHERIRGSITETLVLPVAA